MGGKRILSDAQIEEMCALRERGWGIDRIAQHFTEQGTKVSASSINWQCLKHGADTLIKFRGKHRQAPANYRRGDHIVRPFTKDEDALLRELELKGFRIYVIAERLGRKPNSIRGRLLTLARIEARAEDIALQESA